MRPSRRCPDVIRWPVIALAPTRPPSPVDLHVPPANAVKILPLVFLSRACLQIMRTQDLHKRTRQQSNLPLGAENTQSAIVLAQSPSSFNTKPSFFTSNLSEISPETIGNWWECPELNHIVNHPSANSSGLVRVPQNHGGIFACSAARISAA